MKIPSTEGQHLMCSQQSCFSYWEICATDPLLWGPEQIPKPIAYLESNLRRDHPFPSKMSNIVVHSYLSSRHDFLIWICQFFRGFKSDQVQRPSPSPKYAIGINNYTLVKLPIGGIMTMRPTLKWKVVTDKTRKCPTQPLPVTISNKQPGILL